MARPQVRGLRASQIREVANAGLGRSDILAFWFGESDQSTPTFIREAAAKALMDGRTFYTHNLGRPDLRAALSAYLSNLHGVPIAADRLAVTSAGVSALMIAAQSILEPGDRVVVVTPVWPNVVEIPKVMGAQVTCVSLAPANGRWNLDLDRLLAALTPDTAMLFLNSPNNPTGWTLPAGAQRAILPAAG
jgi:aspartate aminotransferase